MKTINIYEIQKLHFEKIFGEGEQVKIIFKKDEYNGLMYGNKECSQQFFYYSYLLTQNFGVLKCCYSDKGISKREDVDFLNPKLMVRTESFPTK